MAMEFWGAEVKAGEPFKVKSQEGYILHLSQASLGEVKKDKNESVLVSVNIDGKKLILGTLSADKCPQIAYDLVFEKDFEISHNWKNGSVYFVGYKAEVQEEESDHSDSVFESDSEEEDEELPVVAADNGKTEAKTEKAKAPAEKAKADKPENAAAKKAKDVKPEDDSDDSDDDSEEDDSDDSDEDMLAVENDSDDSEDDSSEEEEDTPTPKNVKQSKKRTAEPSTKTPVAEKKAKLVTPQKSGGDGKKGGNTHTATPHPKKAAKTGEKSGSKPQTPKSAGSVTCKSCSKTFNSDSALQSHSKAKHGDAK